MLWRTPSGCAAALPPTEPCGRECTLCTAQVMQLAHVEELRLKLAAVPKTPSPDRGAASSVAAAPQTHELTQVETTGAAAIHPTTSWADGWIPVEEANAVQGTARRA